MWYCWQVHNLCWMMTSNAYGLITFFHGPHLGHGNDLIAFRDSNIYNLFRNSLVNAGLNMNTFALLGDKIFIDRYPNFLSLPRGEWDALTRTDSRCRTSAEWSNDKITENWKRITYQNQLKIFLAPVAQEITVAAILTNCLTIEQGGQTALYFQNPNEPFGLEMPTLEEYFEIEND